MEHVEVVDTNWKLSWPETILKYIFLRNNFKRLLQNHYTIQIQ